MRHIHNTLIGHSCSRIHLSTGRKDNSKNLCTFGRQVFVQPPGIQAKKFKDKARRGIFLVYVPHATKTLFGMMLTLKAAKLLHIILLTKDLMMLLLIL